MRRRLDLAELVRYGATGIALNLVNLGSFALLAALGTPYLAAAIASGGLAMACGFVLGRGWVFGHGGHSLSRQGSRYALVFVAAALLGFVGLVAFVEGAGLPAVAGQACAILLVAPLSYLAQKHFTFAPRQAA